MNLVIKLKFILLVSLLLQCSVFSQLGLFKEKSENDNLLLLGLAALSLSSQQEEAEASPKPGKILMFISFQNTYYSEYKVSIEALKAAGYEVDVRSAGSGQVSSYSVTGNIQATANDTSFLPGASYAHFLEQFQNFFGKAWDPAWNDTATTLPVDGKIQDVTNMDEYVALVVPGGNRATDYRYDGSYVSQNNGTETIPASEVQAVAEKINELSLDALSKGKPILFQCHAASLAAYLRVPNTGNPGTSLLSGQAAAGYPTGADASQTANDYVSLGVTYRNDDRVVVSSPNSGFVHNGRATNKIITMRDWYPQTIAYSIRTLLNVIESSPEPSDIAVSSPSVSVLIVHGGAVNIGNCAASNRTTNDVPCNYQHLGAGNLPADYNHLQTLLNANSPNDEFSFNVTTLDLSQTSSALLNNKEAFKAELKKYQSVIFFKHWNTFITQALQDALYEYADEGGGLVGLHHGLYNDVDGGGNKNRIVDIFQVQSATSGFGANLYNYNLYSTNYGHFISTFGITLSNASATSPGAWTSWNPVVNGGNSGRSTFQNFSIYDELYHNMQFVNGASFGRAVNQIQPLFSNNQAVGSQVHTSGFIKKFNPSGDSSIGKVVFLQAGERQESLNIAHRYGQVLRNAVLWSAKGK